MHFLFTAPRFHTNQHYSVKALLDAGHQVTFLAMARGQSELYDALRPTILPESPLMRSMGISAPSVSDLIGRMRALKPDVVVVRNPSSAYGLLSVATARLLRLTVVFYSQTPMHRRLGWWRRLARSLPARLAGAKWITPVLGAPDAHAPAFTALRYVPFVMEPQTAPCRSNRFRDGTINVLCIGKFERRKNHRTFLQAIADLSDGHSIRATVVGECTTPEQRSELIEVQHLRKSLGLCGRVNFRINLPYWDVQREYQGHDLFVLPSRDEPAAVSPLEAMSHSLPVICSDSNGTQCYVRPGENGYIFRTDDLDHLVECMERIISDRERLKQMGARSYEVVLSEHSPSRYVESMVAIAEGRG